MRALLARLGGPQAAFETVLIAGTNGKGGTVAHLTAMLRANGRGPVGGFTSPHLTDPGERIAVDGASLEPATFEALAAEVLPHADAVEATFFEVVTAMACLHFVRAGVVRAVFEVGLGGRWDATNALEPVACGIASIALDHQEILGRTLAEIAREKAGILRPGVPAWSSARGAAADALRESARSVGAPLQLLGSDAELFRDDLAFGGSQLELRAAGAPPLSLRTCLVGAGAAENAALAALIARDLGASDDAIAVGASAVRWPGRFEVIGANELAQSGIFPDGPPGGADRLILDGAHNPAAAEQLSASLQALGVRPQLVLGAGQDKDVTGILARLAPVSAALFATQARTSPRALPHRTVGRLARSLGIPVDSVHDDPREAVRAAWHAAGRSGDPASRTVLIAGSLFLIGEVRPWLLNEPLSTFERWQ